MMRALLIPVVAKYADLRPRDWDATSSQVQLYSNHCYHSQTIVAREWQAQNGVLCRKQTKVRWAHITRRVSANIDRCAP
jgi:hypothetical protein